MSALQSTLQSLAASFAEEVVRAIQGSSLQELLGEVSGPKGRAPIMPRSAGAAPARAGRAAAAPKRSSGRLKRRSPDDIMATLERIVTLLKSNPEGLRAEQIRKELDVEAKELPRPLAEGLSAKTLRKKGQKRATVYYVSSGGAAETAKAPRAAKTRKKAKA